MSCGRQSTGAQSCGCCTGVEQLTPTVIANRSALPAIAYRVGSYGTFLASMLAALSGTDVPALAGLRTRDSSDFSIALIDAWSEVLDILTFYIERLANEAYLGTAIESRSVFELARLVGYKPSPGVSASTVLAFTLASAPGSPAHVPIPAGTRVQSVPGPGQKPQVFETSGPFTATIANNAIPAATSQPWQLNGGDTSTWIAGTANNLHVGDALLFIAASNGVPSLTGPAAVCYVTAATIDANSGNTFLEWDQALPSGFSNGATDVCLYVFRTKAALYGANAPKPGMFGGNVVNIPGNPGASNLASADWSWQYADWSFVVNLDNAYTGLKPTAHGSDAPADQSQWMVLTGPQYTSFFQVKSASESNPGLYSLSAKTTQLNIAYGTVLAGDTNLGLNELLYLFVQETRVTTAYVQSQLLEFADIPLTAWDQGTTYKLRSGMIAPTSGNSVLLTGPQALAEGAPVGVSGKRARIVPTAALKGSGSSGLAGGFTPSGSIGALPATANQAFLVDAFPPAQDQAISNNLLWSVLTPSGQSGVLSVPADSFELQPSATTDPLVGEATLVAVVTVNGATTSLTLAAPLNRIYDAPTVRLNANAVEAAHGETVMEIIGSGDATNPALQFQLKQAPLTYTSAATETGVQSTLQVRVNNLLWTETPNLLSASSRDRVFVTRPNANGGPTIQFGDGVQGSRTPTGTANIQAKYRKGIGVAGMVAAGQLSQPIDRPQGLQSVTNPSAATGGADPATAASAQQSAPLPTLTLGRIVSLEDYQNFALGFPGISMALATWTWFGNRRGIFLTLAGEGGTTLNSNDLVVQNLLQAYQKYGLPNMPVMAVSYQPQTFEVGLQVMADTPTYDPDAVVAQVWKNLSSAFAFGQLAPGQGVAASRVLEIAQQVPGVIAVNLTALNLSGDANGVANMLCAAGPILPDASSSNSPAGAQVLLLDPASEGNVVVWS